jgi:aldose 1-epimerase
VILPSGTQYDLVFGDQRVTVVEVGGGLRAYTVGTRHVLDGYVDDTMCRSGRGQVLAPWPNRLEGGTYTFDGVEHRLALTEPESGSAIHGLVRWANWDAVERDNARVVMEHLLHPQPGYPFTLLLRVEYALGADGLSVRTSAENVGAGACPFGAGHHPYVAAPTGRVDDLVLELAGNAPAPIGATELDTAFADLARDSDGRWRVRAGDVTVWADAAWPYVQVFTGDPLPDVARRSLAVEPMTCPPNAFQTGEGLIRLEPGESFTGAWGIALS